VHLDKRQSDDLLGELDRVGDGCRRADKDRLRAVGRRQPPQPPQDQGHVRAKYSAVRVQFVDYHHVEV
jgi:hypothetical protein